MLPHQESLLLQTEDISLLLYCIIKYIAFTVCVTPYWIPQYLEDKALLSLLNTVSLPVILVFYNTVLPENWKSNPGSLCSSRKVSVMQEYRRLKNLRLQLLFYRELGGKTGERQYPGYAVPMRWDHLKPWQDPWSLKKCKNGKLGCRVLRKDLGKRNTTHIVSSLFSWFTDKRRWESRQMREMKCIPSF